MDLKENIKVLNNNNPVQQNQIPINRIFCAFPIFCPSEKMYQRNLKSVISFVEYVKLNPHLLDGSRGFILDLMWGGFSAKQIWFDTIKAYIKNNLEEMIDGNGKANNFVRVFQYDKNYGKAKVINDLFAEYLNHHPEIQFMFTCDSDMIMLKNQIHFFDRLFLAAKCMEEIYEKQTGQKKPFGIVACNQEYHWFEPRQGYTGLNNKIEYELGGVGDSLKMKEEICWASDNCGIAGGVWLLNAKLFSHLSGYKNFNTSYNGEDGHYLQAVTRSGASACVIKTLHMSHPDPGADEDVEYTKWKEECMKSAFVEYDEKKYQENLNKTLNWIEK